MSDRLTDKELRDLKGLLCVDWIERTDANGDHWISSHTWYALNAIWVHCQKFIPIIEQLRRDLAARDKTIAERDREIERFTKGLWSIRNFLRYDIRDHEQGSAGALKMVNDILGDER